MLMRVGVRDRGQHALPGMPACQAEDPLNQANGAHTAGGERGLRPLRQRRSDARTLTHEAIDIGLLSSRRVRFARSWRKDARGDAAMDRDERIAVEDAD